MTRGLHAAEFPRDLAFRSNHKGAALDAHYLLAVHVFLFDDAERIRQLFVGIGKKRERQLELLPEFL